MQIVKYALIVAAVAAVLYLPILSAEFVYDDELQIVIDPYIHQPQHFADVLSLKVMTQGVIDNNRPVNLLSLMLDSVLWGRTPFGYHLTNLLLHSLCSAMVFVLLYAFLKRIFAQKEQETGPLWAAFIGAILFAIHPINSEAVCVIAFREDLLVTAFTLLVLILAEFFPSERKIVNVLLGAAIVLSIFAAAATKENGVVAPFFLLLYWLVVRKAANWRKWAILVAAGFAATLTFMILRFTIVAPLVYADVEKASYLGGSFSRMLAIQPRIWLYQLLELFWPGLMCADLGGYSISNISLTMAIIVLSVVCIAAIILGRKNKIFTLGMLFFVISMLPTSNFIPIYWPMADRYLYLPMFGLSLALSAIICRLKIKKGLPRIFLIIAAFIIGLHLCCFTVERELVWHNSLSLWQDTVNKNPRSFLGSYNLGFALFEKGDYQQALSAFTTTSEINPYKPSVKAAMAMTCDALGRTDDAEEFFEEAVSLNNPYGSSDSLIDSLLWTHSQIRKLQIIADRVSAKKKIK
ncbi:MAG: tetratricopeptide repeat protein [Phycisphaerae bacterium]|jgi:tetratricopeptide (TPR) repeat protein